MTEPTDRRAGDGPDRLGPVDKVDSTDDPSPPDVLGEDDAELLAPSGRSLVAPIAEATGMEDYRLDDLPASVRATAYDDNESDVELILDEPAVDTGAAPTALLPDQALQQSAHRVAVELKRIESEVRRLLEERDPRRKRKLGGTQRWLELEEDVLSWRFAGRFDESTLLQLRQLIARRHYLFRELRFLASTRPTWNT